MHTKTLLGGLCLLLLVSLTGCLPSVVQTEHEYVLLQWDGARWIVLEDDDPLYEQFQRSILSDPYLRRLLLLYEHSTEAFLATNTHSSLSQTLANKPMIALNSKQARLLRDIVVYQKKSKVRIELALGLGQDGQVDFGWARDRFAPVVAEGLLAMMGVHFRQPEGSLSPIYEETSPDWALAAGWMAAFEAIYGQRHPERVAELQPLAKMNPWAQERLYIYTLVPHNGFRQRFQGGVPTAELRPCAEAQRTPGVVASFFYHLLQQGGDYYPQREMLWFANFDAEETPYAKALLALNRMAGSREVSLESFLEAYRETFPAEQGKTESLVKEVFGCVPGRE